MRYAWQLLEEKNRPVITISPDDSALRAAQLMNDAHVGALVVTRADDVVGILSERDVLRRLVVPRLDPASTPVRSIMTSPVITCASDTPLDDIRALVRNRRIRHVPVMDGPRLIGMVSIGDLNIVTQRAQAETILYLEQFMYQA